MRKAMTINGLRKSVRKWSGSISLTHWSDPDFLKDLRWTHDRFGWSATDSRGMWSLRLARNGDVYFGTRFHTDSWASIPSLEVPDYATILEHALFNSHAQG